jgi:hypothetical protein
LKSGGSCIKIYKIPFLTRKISVENTLISYYIHLMWKKGKKEKKKVYRIEHWTLFRICSTSTLNLRVLHGIRLSQLMRSSSTKKSVFFKSSLYGNLFYMYRIILLRVLFFVHLHLLENCLTRLTEFIFLYFRTDSDFSWCLLLLLLNISNLKQLSQRYKKFKEKSKINC